MKLRTMDKTSIQQQIFKAEQEYYIREAGTSAVFYEGVGWAIGPKPPTPEAVAKAQFVDKTFHWKSR